MKPCDNVRPPTPSTILFERLLTHPFRTLAPNGHGPQSQPGRQDDHHKCQTSQHANGRVLTKGKNRLDATDRKRCHPDRCGARRKPAGNPPQADSLDRCTLHTRTGNRIPVVVHQVYRRRNRQHKHQRTHHHQDGIHRGTRVINDRQTKVLANQGDNKHHSADSKTSKRNRRHQQTDAPTQNVQDLNGFETGAVNRYGIRRWTSNTKFFPGDATLGLGQFVDRIESIMAEPSSRPRKPRHNTSQLPIGTNQPAL